MVVAGWSCCCIVVVVVVVAAAAADAAAALFNVLSNGLLFRGLAKTIIAGWQHFKGIYQTALFLHWILNTNRIKFTKRGISHCHQPNSKNTTAMLMFVIVVISMICIILIIVMM